VRLNPGKNNIVVDSNDINYPMLQARVQLQFQLIAEQGYFQSCQAYTLGHVLLHGHPTLKSSSTDKKGGKHSAKTPDKGKQRQSKQRQSKPRGPSPFSLFLQDYRNVVQGTMPEADEKTIRNFVHTLWTKADDVQRQKYKTEAAKQAEE